MKSQIPSTKSQISSNDQNPNCLEFEIWNLFGNWKLEIGNSQKGFSLFELLVVVGITAILTTVVLINFQSLRTQQEMQAASNDLVSKIREVQNFILSGKIVNAGEAADAYEINLSAPASSYAIYHDINFIRTLQETVNFSQNMEVNQLTVGGNGRASVTVRITAPYGVIFVDGAANQTLEIKLNHRRAGQTRIVLLDGISGRIGLR